MDDQNKTNQPFANPNQPKTDEPDVTTSAPVEMEPSTARTDMGQTPAQGVPTGQPMGGTPSPVDASQPQTPQAAPQQQDVTPQPMLEAPKKNTMLMVGVVAAIVVVLAIVGVVVYQAL